jgi:hypothetical protein
LNLHSVEAQPIVGASADCLLKDLELILLELIQRLGFCQFPQGRSVSGERALTSRDDLCLCLQERRSGFLPASLSLSDGSLVSIEERNSRREADGKEAMSFFVCVSRPDVDVWILLSDF